MCNKFRLLTASDIECRVAQAGLSNNGAWASILLYKDARVDQRIMDDTFGPMNWQSEYELIDGRLYCKVSVWDSEKSCWISKMNVGTESNTEAEKGQASDAFKRACYTWGLGVELYSSPKIFVTLNGNEYTTYEDRGKKIVKVSPSFKLSVQNIGYTDDRRVAFLTLKDKGGTVRYTYGSSPLQGNSVPTTRIFYSNTGDKLIKGGKKWQSAIEKTRAGECREDGTPYPIFIADYFNVPTEDMKDFINEVNKTSDTL